MGYFSSLKANHPVHARFVMQLLIDGLDGSVAHVRRKSR
jgi:hypothetical protein